jgi:4-carboxymuconolactone decarboxylase
MVRVPQVTDKATLPPSYHDLFDRIAQARGTMDGPYSILFHSPAIAEQLDKLPTALRNESVLRVQEFVLAALAVARAKDCLFVWSVQVTNARRAGISDAVVAAIRDRSTDGLDPDETAIVQYVQQLVRKNRVDQALFERLKERYGVRWLVELTVAAGNFELISGINNAFEVPPPADGDLLLV